MAKILVLNAAVLIQVSVIMIVVGFLQFLVSESARAEIVKQGRRKVVNWTTNLRAGTKFNPVKLLRAIEDQSFACNSWCLPEDLVIDQILSRLPVKSLMRFKSVCKRWHTLPTTPSFIASHLKYIDTPNRLVSWNGNNNGLLAGDDAFHVFTESHYVRYFQPVNLNFGFDRKPDLVLGPCDGIFCLYWRANSVVYPRYVVDEVNVERLPIIALWNPATRAFSILPMSKFYFPPYRKVTYCMVGFGFDLTTKSIKVVKVSCLSRHEIAANTLLNCAEVYDLGSGSWRELQLDDIVQHEVVVDDDLIVSMYNNNDGVFHWHCARWTHSCLDHDEVVLSFDMSTELFHVTLLPKKYRGSSSTVLKVIHDRVCSFALLRGYLAVIFSFFDEEHTLVEVWVMKDFDHMVEVGESLSSYRWSHELSVKVPVPGRCAAMGFWNKAELLIWKDIELLKRISGRSTLLYNIVSKQARDAEISGELNFIYGESLVLVK